VKVELVVCVIFVAEEDAILVDKEFGMFFLASDN